MRRFMSRSYFKKTSTGKPNQHNKFQNSETYDIISCHTSLTTQNPQIETYTIPQIFDIMKISQGLTYIFHMFLLANALVANVYSTCTDDSSWCSLLSSLGFCENNLFADSMAETCAKTCDTCTEPPLVTSCDETLKGQCSLDSGASDSCDLCCYGFEPAVCIPETDCSDIGYCIACGTSGDKCFEDGRFDTYKNCDNCCSGEYKRKDECLDSENTGFSSCHECV